MVLGALGVLGLRAGSILGANLGQQTVKQAIASSAIFGLGYGGLTNVGYNVANVGTSILRPSGKRSNSTKTFTLGMPYGRYYPRRYRRYSRYSSRYPRRYSRYGRKPYSGRRYY